MNEKELTARLLAAEEMIAILAGVIQHELPHATEYITEKFNEWHTFLDSLEEEMSPEVKH